MGRPRAGGTACPTVRVTGREETMFRMRFLGALAGLAVVAIPVASAQNRTESAASLMAAAPAADVAAPAATSRPSGPQQNPLEYRIGPGDVLGIEVWKEPDASSAAAPVTASSSRSISGLML